MIYIRFKVHLVKKTVSYLGY